VVSGRDDTEGRRIIAAGVTRKVRFEAINEWNDGAYRKKFGGNPYLKSMIGEQARCATVKVTPHQDVM
jgi:hypothetical protein